MRNQGRIFQLLVVCALAAAMNAGAQSEVAIEKATNGQDADVPPGVVLIAGSPVTWSYVVTNTGSRPLTDITVTDDQGVTVTCPGTTLGAGLSMTCNANGTAVLGQYANIGTVVATTPDSAVVTDSDPSHYFGQAAAVVMIEKSTNGFDADTPPGPSIPAGSAVDWEYVITNIGTESLTDVTVSDDQGVTVTCPGTPLAAGESMTCTASGVAQTGQYANLGTVTATLPSEEGVADSDPSHYYGQTLLLVKRTNEVESATAPGPVLVPGSTVTWTYEVTNPGPATVTGLLVTDDQGVTVSCPETTLAGGESVVCTGSGVAQVGQYANLGTATATLPLGGIVTASDISFYLGNPLMIEKATNGVDADAPPGPSIAPGDPVNWTYLVTNTGSDPLTDVTVTDDQGVTVTCPQTTLAAGESITCTASGVATAGQYANVGTVEGTAPDLTEFSASDPSHYFGQTVVLDFGDAPDPTYQSLLASNGARHVLGGGVFLGACVDSEPDAFTSAGGDGDDLAIGNATFGTCATAGDDEDGVTFTSTIRVGLTASLDVVASAPCTLSAWIDFVGDGDWGDPGEDLFPGGTALVAGTNSRTFAVPATATPGSTFARFRCTTDGAVGFTGEASDGEVEDYQVDVILPVPAVSAAKDDALVNDVDGDGLAEPGDTLRYTIVITNSGTGDATSVALSDTPDGNTALVVGSVTTTSGTVLSGNGAGDASVSVAVGTMAAFGSSTTITFDVLIDDPLPSGTTTVSNQGMVSGMNFSSLPTDDPALPGAADPTLTPISLVPLMSSAKTVEIIGGTDGFARPGDTLRYTVTITNGGTEDAFGVVFTDTPDSNTALVNGSVTTTAGVVTSGNTAGDASLAVDVGTLIAGGGSVTIVFDVTIPDPLERNVLQIVNAGMIAGSNFTALQTDDPSLPGSADATAVQIAPANIPTLSGW
ncbi:MAG: DUF11 domain-containing protein, partial [Acidobacteria bacterium]|nr:DUF11 domain-containing protein [Acidobacteriota bacterium]